MCPNLPHILWIRAQSKQCTGPGGCFGTMSSSDKSSLCRHATGCLCIQSLSTTPWVIPSLLHFHQMSISSCIFYQIQQAASCEICAYLSTWAKSSSLKPIASHSNLLAGEEAVEYCVNHSEATIIFVSSANWPKLTAALARLQNVHTIVFFGAEVNRGVRVPFLQIACCCLTKIPCIPVLQLHTKFILAGMHLLFVGECSWMGSASTCRKWMAKMSTALQNSSSLEKQTPAKHVHQQEMICARSCTLQAPLAHPRYP